MPSYLFTNVPIPAIPAAGIVELASKEIRSMLTLGSPAPLTHSAKSAKVSGVWWSAGFAIPPCNLNITHFGSKNGAIKPKKSIFYI